MASEKQVCYRAKGEKKCPLHPGQQVLFECEDCPGILVCALCATSSHKKHGFREIKISVKEKEKTIVSFINKTKHETIPSIVQQIKQTIKQLKENGQRYKDQIEQVTNQGQRLKKEVETSTANKVTMLKGLLKENTELLKKHTTELEKMQRDLKSETKECQQTVKSGSDILMFDTEAHVIKRADVQLHVPQVPQLCASTFIPCEDPKPHIERAFGGIMEEKIVPGDRSSTSSFDIQENNAQENHVQENNTNANSQQSTRLKKAVTAEKAMEQVTSRKTKFLNLCV